MLLPERESFSALKSASSAAILDSWFLFTLSSNAANLLFNKSSFESNLNPSSLFNLSRAAIRLIVLSGGFLLANVSYSFYISNLDSN